MKQRKIGILAMQGDFAKHEAMLKSLGVKTILVKQIHNLQGCDGLIIPGGESTTLTKLIRNYGLHEPLRKFAKRHPIMGTCAGLILVADHVDDERVEPLRLIDITALRNAYGTQIDSFITQVDMQFLKDSQPFRAVFIRAPQIQVVGDNVDEISENSNV